MGEGDLGGFFSNFRWAPVGFRLLECNADSATDTDQQPIVKSAVAAMSEGPMLAQDIDGSTEMPWMPQSESDRGPPPKPTLQMPSSPRGGEQRRRIQQQASPQMSLLRAAGGPERRQPRAKRSESPIFRTLRACSAQDRRAETPAAVNQIISTETPTELPAEAPAGAQTKQDNADAEESSDTDVGGDVCSPTGGQETPKAAQVPPSMSPRTRPAETLALKPGVAEDAPTSLRRCVNGEGRDEARNGRDEPGSEARAQRRLPWSPPPQPAPRPAPVDEDPPSARGARSLTSLGGARRPTAAIENDYCSTCDGASDSGDDAASEWSRSCGTCGGSVNRHLEGTCSRATALPRRHSMPGHFPMAWQLLGAARGREAMESHRGLSSDSDSYQDMEGHHPPRYIPRSVSGELPVMWRPQQVRRLQEAKRQQQQWRQQQAMQRAAAPAPQAQEDPEGHEDLDTSVSVLNLVHRKVLESDGELLSSARLACRVPGAARSSGPRPAAKTPPLAPAAALAIIEEERGTPRPAAPLKARPMAGDHLMLSGRGIPRMTADLQAHAANCLLSKKVDPFGDPEIKPLSWRGKRHSCPSIRTAPSVARQGGPVDTLSMTARSAPGVPIASSTGERRCSSTSFLRPPPGWSSGRRQSAPTLAVQPSNAGPELEPTQDLTTADPASPTSEEPVMPPLPPQPSMPSGNWGVVADERSRKQ